MICSDHLQLKPLFFPEGTRNRTGRMIQFKKGAFHMAVNSQVSLICTWSIHSLLPNQINLLKMELKASSICTDEYGFFCVRVSGINFLKLAKYQSQGLALFHFFYLVYPTNQEIYNEVFANYVLFVPLYHSTGSTSSTCIDDLLP